MKFETTFLLQDDSEMLFSLVPDLDRLLRDFVQRLRDLAISRDEYLFLKSLVLFNSRKLMIWLIQEMNTFSTVHLFFLVADKQFYKGLCPSVSLPSVLSWSPTRPLVGHNVVTLRPLLTPTSNLAISSDEYPVLRSLVLFNSIILPFQVMSSYSF